MKRWQLAFPPHLIQSSLDALPYPSPSTALPSVFLPLQAGIVPEVIPEIQKSAAAPFSLTSFALSTLLVLR